MRVPVALGASVTPFLSYGFVLVTDLVFYFSPASAPEVRENGATVLGPIFRHWQASVVSLQHMGFSRCPTMLHVDTGSAQNVTGITVSIFSIKLNLPNTENEGSLIKTNQKR